MATAPDWLNLVTRAEQIFDQKHYAEAADLAARALQLNPASEQAYQVLGLVDSELGRPHEAIPKLHKALALRPNLVPTHNGLGRLYTLLGDTDQALHHLDAALVLDPAHAFAHFNRALVWLRRGQYREGWVEYEWRWNCGLVARPDIPRPRWDGSPLNGRSILIHTEQGIGDVLQFIRLLPLLKKQAGRVVLACQKALHALLRNLPNVDSWFPIDAPGDINFEMYSPLLSLPALLGIHDESAIPREVPYVFVEPERVERWRPRVQALPGFKVGLCWQGSPTFKGDEFRSIPLERFAPLAAVPNVTFVSLQKGAGSEQVEANRGRLPLVVFDDLDRDAPFVDTAALMQHLDLVITSDTAIPHLAGALGRPVWVALGIGADWRFLEGRSDSPWYPNMRLFRQRAFGDWPGVFQEMADALRAKIVETRRGDLAVPVSVGELLDKITILEIKRDRIADAAKRANVLRELELLQAVRREAVAGAAGLDELVVELRNANERLWEIEDDIRACEREGDFGEKFVELARSVYMTNDRRSLLKRRINELLGSAIVEEKAYTEWGQPGSA
jgi:ADP-heptose:LPS heptosyltransferase